MKTELNSKEYVTFARRFVKETVDQMDFEQLKSLVIHYIHEDLQKSYDDIGQTAVFENIRRDTGQVSVFEEMASWDSELWTQIAIDFDIPEEAE